MLTKYNVHVHALNTSLIDYCGGGDIISWSCWGSIVTASSVYLSMDRRRAFMKKLATVETLSPNCSAMVACISLDGRLVSLKMAYRVRLWMSVKTSRGFLGPVFSVRGISRSLRLQAGKKDNATLMDISSDLALRSLSLHCSNFQNMFTFIPFQIFFFWSTCRSSNFGSTELLTSVFGTCSCQIEMQDTTNVQTVAFCVCLNPICKDGWQWVALEMCDWDYWSVIYGLNSGILAGKRARNDHQGPSTYKMCLAMCNMFVLSWIMPHLAYVLCASVPRSCYSLQRHVEENQPTHSSPIPGFYTVSFSQLKKNLNCP